MNNTQRVLLTVYLPMTFVILILDNIYPGQDMVQYVKYATMITLFLSVNIIRKKYREQNLMALSFIFVVLSDFFLVFSTTLHNIKMNFAPLGILGFLFAYLFLIAAYQKNFKVAKAEIIAAIPIIIIYIYVVASLHPYVKGPMLIGALIFSIVLCYMTWTAICTLFRNYFTLKAACLIALSGSLMFICDMGVAFSMFHPAYAGAHVAWIKNIIWGAYVPGWTLLAVVISEKKLRKYK